jgi:DNA-binding transcriptional LysR family regulator
MDIDLLRTFLEVNRTRHFGRASENLYLTQSAVSARIRLLEETLGASVFTRTRNDIQLTPAGTRLVKHAETIVGAWNRARRDAAFGTVDKTLLAVGGVPALWDILLQEWIQTLCRKRPDVALEAQSHGPDTLVRRLLDGAIDVAFLFEAPELAELVAREVAAVRLIMVAAQPGRRAQEAVSDGYIMTEWGTPFAVAHAQRFPDMPPPAVRLGPGRMALDFLLGCGGAAYCVEAMVQDFLVTNRLFPVADAPAFDQGVYAVYHQAGARRAELDQALVFLTLAPTTPATVVPVP